MLLNTGWSSAHIHDFLKASSAQDELDNSQMHSAVSEEINMSNATSTGIEHTKEICRNPSSIFSADADRNLRLKLTAVLFNLFI